MKSRVAYVVVCWNNKKLLDSCLSSIKNQDYNNKKIIVVDNASSDGSQAYIENTYPEVELLKQKKNYAFAKGNNIGIKYALEDKKVEYVVLVNTDATLDLNWTSTLIKFAKNKPIGAAFQTITLDYFNHRIIDSTHIYISKNGQGTQGSWRRSILNDTDISPCKVFGCNAAAVMYSRKFIESQPFSDFFDETMWMYLEDVDVAARATVMGWDNYTVPGARAYHMGSASSGKNPGFALYLTFRNNLGLLVKNLPLDILIKILPKLVKGDIDTIKTLKKTGRSSHIKFVLKGRLIGLVMLPAFLVKRSHINRIIDSKTLWRIMQKGL